MTGGSTVDNFEENQTSGQELDPVNFHFSFFLFGIWDFHVFHAAQLACSSSGLQVSSSNRNWQVCNILMSVSVP